MKVVNSKEMEELSEAKKESSSKQLTKSTNHLTESIRILFFLLVLLMFPLVEANTITGNLSSLAYHYELDEPITPVLSLNMNNEESSNLVSITLDKAYPSISLPDFLNSGGAAIDENYTCTPLRKKACATYYKTLGSADLIKPITNSKLLGFSLTGKDVNVQSLSFDINASAPFPNNKVPPVTIDILDDTSLDWQYLKSEEFNDQWDDLHYSSYFDFDAAGTFVVQKTMYCEKILLKRTSKVKLAALINKTGENSEVWMSIYDPDNENGEKKCNLSAIPSDYDYLNLPYCIVNFTVNKEKEYRICVYDNMNSNNISIRGENTGAVGGYARSGVISYSSDFGIYAQSAKILDFSSAHFDKDEFASMTQDPQKTLLTYLNNYLYSYYSIANCDSGCIIPLSITTAQNVEISNIQLQYQHDGVVENSKVVYNASKEPSLINGSATLDLSFVGISAPKDYGTYPLNISIGSYSLLKNIFVAGAPQIKSLSPLNPAVKTETNFTAIVISPVNRSIFNFTWDFGDGTTNITKINTVAHMYSNLGTYSMLVNVTDAQGISSVREFNVTVEAPKEITNITLNRKTAALDAYLELLKGLPWYGSLVRKKYNIDSMTSLVQEASDDLEKAESDQEYLDVKERLDRIKIPVSVYKSAELIKTIFYPKKDRILLKKLQDLGAGDYDTTKAEDIKEAIAMWQAGYLDFYTSTAVYSSILDTGEEERALTFVSAELAPKISAEGVYFIILLPEGVKFENVVFAKDYGQTNVDGDIGFKFDLLEKDESKTIEFAIPGEYEVSDEKYGLLLTMFASTPFNELYIAENGSLCGNKICESGEDYKKCPADCKPVWPVIKMVLIVIVCFILGLLLIWRVYAVIYDRMLRKKLFKTNQNYLNILIYASSALNKGEKEYSVGEKLKKEGWKPEQVEYIMKKSEKAKKRIDKLEKKVQKQKTKEEKQTPAETKAL